MKPRKDDGAGIVVLGAFVLFAGITVAAGSSHRIVGTMLLIAGFIIVYAGGLKNRNSRRRIRMEEKSKITNQQIKENMEKARDLERAARREEEP